jgi:LysR family transcriptional regulator, cyn operon transcriptional activator
MELHHLRAFATVVEAGGFARAAARLNLSQPALSRQIRALEARLDVALFDRLGRRVQLTAEGEDLLQRVRRLLTDAESLGERARTLKRGQTGVLRVGATPQATETLLAGFLPGYRRRHPGVQIHLVEDGGVRLATRLDRGDVNLAFTAAGDARFSARLLAPLYVLAVRLKSRGGSGSATLEIEALANEPLLLLRRDFASREWFDTACQVAHLRPRVLLESGAPHTLIALAQAGYGVAIIPSNVRIPPGKLSVTPLVQRGAPIGRWLTIAWDPRRFLTPYAEQFVEEVVDHVRRRPRPRFLRGAPPLPRAIAGQG